MVKFQSKLSSFYKLPRGGIVIVMGKHSRGDRKANGGRFVDFCGFQPLVTSSTFLAHRAYHKVSLVSNDRHRAGNQIDYFVVTNRFRNCILKSCNQRVADIGLEMNHHLMVAYHRLRVASPSFGRVEALQH